MIYFGSEVFKILSSIFNLKKLGYRPKTSLKDGLKTTIEWYINYFNKNV